MIEPVTEHNLDRVLPLIRQYQAFYNITNISDARNKTFFSQFGPHSEWGCQFTYIDDSTHCLAFATVYFTFTTSISSKVAVLNDLYTLPSARGKGIARSLIEHCRAYGKSKGAARLQWVTAPDNTKAQKLYDSLETSKSSWLFYTY